MIGPTDAEDTRADLNRFLDLLWLPGDVREIRSPAPRRVASGYFDNPDRLAAAVAAWDGRANLYVTMNPVRPALLARYANRIEPDAKSTTADADIVERRFLLVDIDPRRPSGISSTTAETEAARDVARDVRAYLTGLGWPGPIVAMTGNGYALLYRIELPNDVASTRLVNDVLGHLAERFDSAEVEIDTTVSNAARIACLVGTVKRKGDATPDRPHRRSALVQVPTALEVVPGERLAELTPASETVPRPAAGPTDSSMPAGWVREWLNRAGVAYREKVRGGTTWYQLAECPFHPGEDLDGDCGVGEAAGGMALGKCFHNRGAGRDWHDFRQALRLEAPPAIRILPSPEIPAKANGHDGPFRFYSPLELAELTLPSPDWIVRPGLAAIGSITEIDGKIKAAGKTTLILWMIRATLDGEPFLGEPTRRVRVVYVTEQSKQTFMDALRLAGLAERGDELRILHREDFGGAPWAAIVAACRIDGYELVVFDTIGKLAGIREENSAGEWAIAMTPLQDLAAAGRAVIVARHDRKGGGEVGDSGRGSSQASGDVDIILAIRRPEGNQPGTRRVVETLSRYRETPEKVVVDLTADGYVLLGTAEAVAAQEADAFVRSAIGSEFRTNGIGPDLAELAALGDKQDPKVKRTNISAALGRLYADRQIERSGAGKKGDPYRYTPYGADSFRTQTVENETLNESGIEDDDPQSAWSLS